jgi:hypothetical protein
VLQTFEPAKITVSSENAGMKLKNSTNQSHKLIAQPNKEGDENKITEKKAKNDQKDTIIVSSAPVDANHQSKSPSQSQIKEDENIANALSVAAPSQPKKTNLSAAVDAPESTVSDPINCLSKTEFYCPNKQYKQTKLQAILHTI